MSLPTIHPSHPLLLKPEPLTPSSFSPFGTVITAPLPPSLTSFPTPIPKALYPAYQPQPVPANQSTALKTSPVSPLVNAYPVGGGDGRKGGTGLMSIFSSFPRRNVYVSGDGNGDGDGGSGTPRLKLGILERHPFTTQTFCPFNYSTLEQRHNQSQRQPSPSHSHSTPSPPPKTYILIIVAPTLPSQSTNPQNPPDLARLRVFIHPLNDPDATNVAVTYNAGTWHAPMIVLGSRRVDFLVTQFANGVAGDDCQEVLVGGGPDGAVLGAEERRRRRLGRMGGGKGREVEVDLRGWGVEVEVEGGSGDGDGDTRDGEVKWTTDEVVLKAVRASKL